MPLVVTRDNVDSLVARLKSEAILAVDTETSGLAWTDRPFLAILATSSEEFLLPLPEFNLELSDILSVQRTLVFQNAKFDCRMLLNGLITYNQASSIVDIAVMARLIKNNHMGKKDYSLAAQAARNQMEKLDVGLKEYIKTAGLYEMRTNALGGVEKQPRYDWVPKDIMYPYAAADARITYDLYQIYQKQLDERDIHVLQNEVALTPVCLQMEMAGIRVDMEYTREARARAMGQLLQAKERFRASTGKEFADSKGVLVPLFQGAGETLYKTPSGQVRLTDKDLERFTSPVAQMVRDIREQQKYISTYYDNYINRSVETEAGYILHPTMWQAGTRTGRFSYSDPNLQNIPKEEKSDAGHVVRGCFIPRSSRVFVSMDYAQQEYRLMLAYANESDLISSVMGGSDVHQATANLVGVTRSEAKTLNFALLYGAGPSKVALMLGIPKKEAEKLIDLYFAKLPNVERLIDDVTRKSRARGYVNNWFGRKLRFGWCTAKDPDTGKMERYHDAYTGPNHLIQSGGADIIKVAMVGLKQQGLISYSCFPVVQIHDQLIFDVNEEGFKDLPKIAKVMEEAFPERNGMRMKVDVKWSDKSMAERDLVEGYPGG